MTRNLEIPFAKFHGLGNDFIVVAGADLGLGHHGDGWRGKRPWRALARSVCDRHTGLGADGFLVVLGPLSNKHHGRVRFFNADGSEAEMSGNGIRCAAAFMHEVGAGLSLSRSIANRAFTNHAVVAAGASLAGVPRHKELQIETVSGVKWVRTVKAETGKWVLRVGMGMPILDPEKIPFTTGGFRRRRARRRSGRGDAGFSPVVGFPVHTLHGMVRVTVTSMGNPHCSLFVTDFDAIGWPSIGREIENSPFFPNRTNVEFVRVISKREIEVRFWERGVGQTASSGTGSCGAVVACILNGLTSRKVRVRTLAGNLEVAWPEKREVTLTGPVKWIARGAYHYRG